MVYGQILLINFYYFLSDIRWVFFEHLAKQLRLSNFLLCLNVEQLQIKMNLSSPVNLIIKINKIIDCKNEFELHLHLDNDFCFKKKSLNGKIKQYLTKEIQFL